MTPNHLLQEKREADLAAEARAEAVHAVEATVVLEADLAAEAQEEAEVEAEAGLHQKQLHPKFLVCLDSLLPQEKRIYERNSGDLENSKE
eukprot:CAMPEP_0168551148 /NCGR_PEP_ID=MMETSP0413-20121227/6015_1 /TAXON_ID=136452 /ORGANISM="Filamoeba nolandi, Strain NC-AS-23-1" /LENGTH=89 /DNA_ID=CAMNT_0008581649 /DNA_START=113 /DNA_END=382 /DNA_ORIENTATION=+